MVMTWLFLSFLNLIFYATLGYLVASRVWKRRVGHAMKLFAENVNECWPMIPALGMQPIFDHALVNVYGQPPARIAADLSKCDECGHLTNWHRPTITFLAVGDESQGDTVPMNLSLVCQHGKGKRRCHCVVQAGTGGFVVDQVLHPDDDD